MFGYVRPSDRRLSEQEREAFRTAYCGLCHAFGKRYGLVGRMILNYDLTFLAMVLSDGAGRTECRRCAIHPVKGCPCAEGDPALNTAADMSVILTYWQLRDGVADHGFWGGLKYRVASALLGRAYRKARQALPWFDRGARQQLDELSALERESCPTLDEPADAFARLLALAAGEIVEEKRRRVTEQLLYHLGRWIYFMDAWDDLEKDRQSGAFNPFLTESRETAAFCIHSAMSQCRQAASLLPLTRDRGLIENILELGCPHRAVALLGQTPEEDKKLEERDEPL